MREQGRQDFADRDPRRTMSQKDLQSMLDRMQDLARSGDRANAQKMLEQLQNMLENLQMGRREQDPSRRDMNKALNDLDQMSREQEELRDDTHKQGAQPDENDMRPGQPRRRMPGMPQQQGRDEQRPGNQQGQRQEGDKGLQQRQQALRDKLDQLQKRMQQQGRGQQPGLKDAGKAMQEAEQALGQGQQGLGEAEDAQGRAIEALRREADNLAQQLQQGEGQSGNLVGEEEGENGESMRAQGSEDSDPLGRPLASDPLNPRAHFDPMGVPAAQRAQRVLEELRRRLADPFRPREEMDYLERLLKRY
jgi:DNA repair exonuclease SbcCD ATPase subunit